MFTGIIEETGTAAALISQGVGARLQVRAEKVLADLPIGGSIAVNGVCLTAVEVAGGSFSADLSPETLERSNLGDLRPGARVNLERPLAPTSRLSGHFVQGHVDGIGELVSLAELGDGNWWLSIRAPRELLRYFVYKGSIAIDGISLSIASLENDAIGVAIIPHTYEATSLANLQPGGRVNLECDVIAKHVERLVQSLELPAEHRLSVEKLRGEGF
jgi:riboflavin synthase